jgi:hypothetical protein
MASWPGCLKGKLLPRFFPIICKLIAQIPSQQSLK